MASSSILSLNDDCLSHIVSYIHDPYSFHSIILSCKRLNQVVTSIQNQWHSSIRRAKNEYPIKRALVDIVCGEDCDNRIEYSYGLAELLDNAIDLSFKKEIFSYPKLIDVWLKYGPVAAKLFSWMQNQSSTKKVSAIGPKFSSHFLVTTFNLPRCNQEMTISAKYIHQNDPVMVEIGANRLGFQLYIYCESIDVEYQGSIKLLPDEYLTWDNVEKKKIIQKMNPVIELLQNELGETSPHITANFFLWFCLFLTLDKILPEGDKLSFKDREMNEKPTVESFKLSAPNAYHLAEKKFNHSVSKSKELFGQVTESVKSLADTLYTLAQQTETKVLRNLKEVFLRFLPISKEFCHYCPKSFLQKALLGLFLRTSLEPREYIYFSMEDEKLENLISFQLKDGDVLKVSGKILYTGIQFNYDYKFTLKFVLPDGEVIELETEQKIEGGFIDNNTLRQKWWWIGLPWHFPNEPLAIEKLGPVTGLLQECINHSMQGKDVVPKIQNIFTAVYFLIVLDCCEVLVQFEKQFDESNKWTLDVN